MFDYRPLLKKARFEVNIYNETPDWERRQREVYERILESKRLFLLQKLEIFFYFLLQ